MRGNWVRLATEIADELRLIGAERGTDHCVELPLDSLLRRSGAEKEPTNFRTRGYWAHCQRGGEYWNAFRDAGLVLSFQPDQHATLIQSVIFRLDNADSTLAGSQSAADPEAADLEQAIIPTAETPTGFQLTITDIEAVFDRMLVRIESLIAQRRRLDILNERFWHHMFSWEVCRMCAERDTDVWDDLLLAPECPTASKFRRSAIDMENEEATRNNAVGIGRAGNFDFVLRSTPPISIEWKGPSPCGSQELFEAFLKLLSEDPDTVKVFAGFYTSSITGKYGHVPDIQRRVRDAIESAMRVLNRVELERNLYVFVATLPDTGKIKIYWGKAGTDFAWTTPTASRQ